MKQSIVTANKPIIGTIAIVFSLLLVMLLAALGFSFFGDPVEPLFAMINRDDLAGIKKTLEQDKSKLSMRLNGRTPLQYAIIADSKAFYLLVKAGADIDQTDEYGNTPLHLAIYHRRYVLVEYLVKVGANVNSANSFGQTPLYIVAYTGLGGPALKALLARKPRDIYDADLRQKVLDMCRTNNHELEKLLARYK